MSVDYLSQETEINIVNLLIPKLENKSFVDIGAEKGSFALSMLKQGMAGVLFEPMPKHFSWLETIVKKYPNVSLFKCAITNLDSTQSFNVATDAQGHELDYYHSLQKAYAPGVFEHCKSFNVECRSIQSLVEKNQIPSELGILKTDTEGNDLNVLKGLGALRPELVVCEFFCQGLYNGWAEGSPEPIIQYMNDLGYKQYIAIKRAGNSEFISAGPTLFESRQWGNLLFFRADFYQKVGLIIAECLHESEKNLLKKFMDLSRQLDEKERVIQSLMFEQSSSFKKVTRFSKLYAWLSSIFK